MAASSILGKITKRAKEIRKKNPKIQWQTAIKKASIELKGTVAPRKTKVVYRAEPFSLNGVKSKTKISGMKRKAAPAKRAKVTISNTLQKAKKMLLEEIGRLEAKKFVTRLKSDRTKIGKTIAEKKSLYKKLK